MKLGYENLKDDDSVISSVSENSSKNYTTIQLILIILGSLLVGMIIYDVLFDGRIWCGIRKLLSDKKSTGYECKDFGNAATGILTS